jgi:hypothetical protein
MENLEFKKCCAIEIQNLWKSFGGPMNIINYQSNCKTCNHYIGLTQTSEEQSKEFLMKFNLI